MLYLVSYDLNKPGQEYKELYKELKNSNNWWHYLDSTWLIVTEESINELNDRIKNKIDKNDSLLIFDITNMDYSGWLSEEAWQWIRNNIDGEVT